MSKKDSGLPGRTETRSTTEQTVDFSPKEYTLSQSFVIAGAIIGFFVGG